MLNPPKLADLKSLISLAAFCSTSPLPTANGYNPYPPLLADGRILFPIIAVGPSVLFGYVPSLGWRPWGCIVPPARLRGNVHLCTSNPKTARVTANRILITLIQNWEESVNRQGVYF